MLFASKFFFLSTLQPIWSSYRFLSICLLVHHQAHSLFFIGIICFIFGRFDVIINILVLLTIFFFSCFLVQAVNIVTNPSNFMGGFYLTQNNWMFMGMFPNVLSIPWPNFAAFFLLSCFVQLGIILLFQLVMWSSPPLSFFPNQLNISHLNWKVKFLMH